MASRILLYICRCVLTCYWIFSTVYMKWNFFGIFTTMFVILATKLPIWAISNGNRFNQTHYRRYNTDCLKRGVLIKWHWWNRHFFQLWHQQNVAKSCLLLIVLLPLLKPAVLIAQRKHYEILVSIIKMFHALVIAMCKF